MRSSYAVSEALATALGIPSRDVGTSPARAAVLRLPAGVLLPGLRYTFGLRLPGSDAVDTRADVQVAAPAVVLEAAVAARVHPLSLPLTLRAVVAPTMQSAPNTGAVVQLDWRCGYHPVPAAHDDDDGDSAADVAAAELSALRQAVLGVGEDRAASVAATLVYVDVDCGATLHAAPHCVVCNVCLWRWQVSCRRCCRALHAVQGVGRAGTGSSWMDHGVWIRCCSCVSAVHSTGCVATGRVRICAVGTLAMRGCVCVAWLTGASGGGYSCAAVQVQVYGECDPGQRRVAGRRCTSECTDRVSAELDRRAQCHCNGCCGSPRAL